MKRIASAVLIALLAVQPAYPLSMKLGVEGGLDKPTRKFLERYPAKVRQEFITALEQALPLIDRGVDRTFDRLDESVSKTASEMRCLIGSGGPAAGSAADRIVKTVLNKPTGNTLTSDLLKFAEDRREKIDSNMPTKTALARYGDVVGTVWEIKCYFKDNEPLITTINSLSAGYYKSNLTWKYVDELGCTSVGACYRQVSTDTSALIKESDPRDVAGANAGARLAALPGADAKLIKGGFEHAPKPKKGQMTLETFEKSVAEMRSIQFDIAVQGLKRAEAANRLLDDNEVAFVRVGQGYAGLVSGISSGSSARIKAAVMGDGPGPGPAAQLKATILAVNVDAALAMSRNETIETRAAGQKATQRDLVAQVDGLVAGYQSRLDAALRQEAEAARRQAAEDRCCAEIH